MPGGSRRRETAETGPGLPRWRYVVACRVLPAEPGEQPIQARLLREQFARRDEEGFDGDGEELFRRFRAVRIDERGDARIDLVAEPVPLRFHRGPPLLPQRRIFDGGRAVGVAVAHVQHVRDFVESVRTRRPPASEPLGAHRSTLASHLANLAYTRKERVVFDPGGELSLAPR